ncbi:MAG: DUF5606 family protein [Bacteroidales bacterium]
MELKEIMSVAGQPGLFKFLSQGRSGLILEALTDKKRIVVPPTAKVSTMSDIAVFTTEEDLPLRRVFNMIKQKHNAQPSVNPKEMSDLELKNYFAEILPTYDRERVYLSDIKKIVIWYNILQQNGMLDFEDKEGLEEDKVKSTEDKSKKVKTVERTAKARNIRSGSTKAAGSAGKINAPRKAQ